jgi:hypothetical protein
MSRMSRTSGMSRAGITIAAAAAALTLAACGDLPNNGSGGGGFADRGPVPSNGGTRSAGEQGRATGVVFYSGSNSGSETGTGAGTFGAAPAAGAPAATPAATPATTPPAPAAPATTP